MVFDIFSISEFWFMEHSPNFFFICLSHLLTCRLRIWSDRRDRFSKSRRKWVWKLIKKSYWCVLEILFLENFDSLNKFPDFFVNCLVTSWELSIKTAIEGNKPFVSEQIEFSKWEKLIPMGVVWLLPVWEFRCKPEILWRKTWVLKAFLRVENWRFRHW